MGFHSGCLGHHWLAKLHRVEGSVSLRTPGGAKSPRHEIRHVAPLRRRSRVPSHSPCEQRQAPAAMDIYKSQFRGCEQLHEVNPSSASFGNLLEERADLVDSTRSTREPSAFVGCSFSRFSDANSALKYTTSNTALQTSERRCGSHCRIAACIPSMEELSKYLQSAMLQFLAMNPRAAHRD